METNRRSFISGIFGAVIALPLFGGFKGKAATKEPNMPVAFGDFNVSILRYTKKPSQYKDWTGDQPVEWSEGEYALEVERCRNKDYFRCVMVHNDDGGMVTRAIESPLFDNRDSIEATRERRHALDSIYQMMTQTLRVKQFRNDSAKHTASRMMAKGERKQFTWGTTGT